MIRIGTADVIRTVALEPTLRNVEVLGLLVVVRTLLSWGMSVVVEGCWPWQIRAHSELQLAERKAERVLEKAAGTN